MIAGGNSGGKTQFMIDRIKAALDSGEEVKVGCLERDVELLVSMGVPREKIIVVEQPQKNRFEFPPNGIKMVDGDTLELLVNWRFD
jgi:hypothetical protein